MLYHILKVGAYGRRSICFCNFGICNFGLLPCKSWSSHCATSVKDTDGIFVTAPVNAKLRYIYLAMIGERGAP